MIYSVKKKQEQMRGKRVDESRAITYQKQVCRLEYKTSECSEKKNHRAVKSKAWVRKEESIYIYVLHRTLIKNERGRSLEGALELKVGL